MSICKFFIAVCTNVLIFTSQMTFAGENDYTDTCMSHESSGWSYHYNHLLVEPSSTNYPHIVRDAKYLDPYHECSNKRTQRFRIVKGETALTPKADLRVIGNLCASQPKLVIERLFINIPLTPENIAYQKSNRRSPYDFYVNSKTRIIGSVHRVDVMLRAYEKLALAQCKYLPESVRVYGRSKFNKPLRSAKGRRLQEGIQKIEYTTFYSGTYYPGRKSFALEHDDAEQAILYQVLEGQFRDYIAKQYRYDPNRAALGLGIIAAWALATQINASSSSGVAVDPMCYSGLTAEERQLYGCPF